MGYKTFKQIYKQSWEFFVFHLFYQEQMVAYIGFGHKYLIVLRLFLNISFLSMLRC